MNQKKHSLQQPKSFFSVLWIAVTLCLLTVNCAPQPQPMLARGPSLTLASFDENSVNVIITLKRDAADAVSLTATFTPLEAGFHLYSKDLPRNGVGGLGRPTLLELSPDSKMQAIGPVAESVPANISSADPSGTLIYPNGPVTLTMPVRLPAGRALTADEISLTYMACSAGGCKAPVIGKMIPIKIPGADALKD